MLGRSVALKLLPAELAQDRKFLERFGREAQREHAAQVPRESSSCALSSHA